MKMKTRIQKKETFKSILLTLGMVVCLFLAGCKDKSDDNNNRGNTHYGKGWYDQAISDFTKALEIEPEFVPVYYNRAVTYYCKREYDKAWEDVHTAQSLGYKVDAEFLKTLRKASGRESP